MLYLSRSKWEVFVGYPQDVVSRRLSKVLNDLDISFKKGKRPPIFMYDSGHEQIIYDLNNLEIALVYVSADPITRLVSNVIGTSKIFTGITYLSVSIHGNDAVARLKTILKAFSKIEKTPWHIGWHPRFRYAILLQQLNRWRWQRMMS